MALSPGRTWTPPADTDIDLSSPPRFQDHQCDFSGPPARSKSHNEGRYGDPRRSRSRSRSPAGRRRGQEGHRSDRATSPSRNRQENSRHMQSGRGRPADEERGWRDNQQGVNRRWSEGTRWGARRPEWERNKIRDNRHWQDDPHGTERKPYCPQPSDQRNGEAGRPPRSTAMQTSLEPSPTLQAGSSGRRDGPTKGVQDFSREFEVDFVAPVKQVKKETDPQRLAARQKQVDLGKNTRGYQQYKEAVPLTKRRYQGKFCVDPVTPDIHQVCSKRAFDGQIKKWRRELHEYDPPAGEDEEEIDLEALVNPLATAGGPTAPPDESACAHNGPPPAAADDIPSGAIDIHSSGQGVDGEDVEDLIYGADGGPPPREAPQAPTATSGDDDDDWGMDDIAV